MNSDKYPIIYSQLQILLGNEPNKINQWIDDVIIPNTEIMDLEQLLSKKPKVLKRILECIVIDSRKIVGVQDSEYTFRPKSFDLVGVVRSDGSFQKVVVTSCSLLEVNRTIDFIDVHIYLTKNLDRAVFKGISFFFSLHPNELQEIYQTYPNLENSLIKEKEFLKNHGLSNPPNMFSNNTELPSNTIYLK